MTCFLPQSGMAVKVLVIESYAYLPKLCAMLPNAKIEAVTRQEDVPEARELRDLDVNWTIMDYRLSRLPFGEESFDYLLAADVLTEAYEPYLELMRLGKLLKGTGELLTQFANIRYQGILSCLRDGDFPVREQHLWAKPEVVRLLNDTLFKEITFAVGEQELGNGEAEFAAQGWHDYQHDLATRIWLVQACRSTATVANLKSMYSPEVRKEISRLLHRLEYGLDTEKNLEELRLLCEREHIFMEYLEDFAQEACAHPERVLEQIQEIK